MKPCLLTLILHLTLIYSLSGQILEIHQVNVGQGDATMIIIRDTTKLKANFVTRGVAVPANRYKMLEVAMDSSVVLTGTIKKAVLIDAGENASTAEAIQTYMGTVGVESFKYFILSHFHKDHYGGFTDLLKQYDVYPDTLVIRRPRFGKSPGKKSNAIIKMQRDPPSRDTLHAMHRQTEIILGFEGGKKISLTCIGTSMATAYQSNDIARNKSSKNDENNFSILWALQYGTFRYYTGGDLNGYTDTGDDPKKIDLETALVDSLMKYDPATLKTMSNGNLNKGHFCTLKLNHHGGEESTNPYFLAVMKPSSAMISCGQQSYKHPRPRVIEDLDRIMKPQWDLSHYTTKALVTSSGGTTSFNKTIQHYFLTNLNMHKNRPYRSTYEKIGNSVQSTGIIGGNIVTVVDSSNPLISQYYVFWDGTKGTTVVSKPTRLYEPNAKGGKYISCHRIGAPQSYLTNH